MNKSKKWENNNIIIKIVIKKITPNLCQTKLWRKCYTTNKFSFVVLTALELKLSNNYQENYGDRIVNIKYIIPWSFVTHYHLTSVKLSIRNQTMCGVTKRNKYMRLKGFFPVILNYIFVTVLSECFIRPTLVIGVVSHIILSWQHGPS